MKEPVHDIRGTESPDDRKRRLARERQRRHREKIRARLRAESEGAPTNPETAISTPGQASQFQQEPRKRPENEVVVGTERHGLQRKSYSQRDPYIDAPDLQSALDERDSATNLASKTSSRTIKTSSVHAQKPGTDRSSGALRRSERQFATKPSLRGEKQDREDKRLGVMSQRQSPTPQKPQDRLQDVHQQHHRRQHLNQPQRHHQADNLRQQQRHTQERSAENRRRAADTDQTAQLPLLEQQREHPSREQQQSDLEKKGQREQHQRPPQRSDYSRHEMLHQQAPFHSNTHGYSATAHQQHTQQPHHQHETGFSFPQTDAGVGQQTYVTDPHRQYVTDAGMHMGATARTYPRFGVRTRPSISNAASSFAAASGTGQGLQNNVASGAPGAVNAGVHGGLALNRDSGVTKYRQGSASVITGVQHASSQLNDCRDSVAVDPYGQNAVETPEERKRRLARERQRRRRKRLKQDSSEPAKVDSDNVHRSQQDAARDPLAGPASVANAPIDIPIHVRGAESNMQPQSSGGMHSGLPNFESPNLASSHPLTGVHSLQVSGVPGGQDDLGGATASRGGFSTHTLGVPGASAASAAASAAASGVLGHPSVGELHRLHPHPEEKLGRAQYPDEDPDTRKRRLARDRQRRRRERLKSRKLGGLSGANAHELKSTGAGTSKPADGIDPRATSDSERRVVGSEGIGESDRIPLGSTGSAVFGTRAEVAQSLAFGDQGRSMRGPSVPDGAVSGMPIGLTGSSMLNLPNVHVNTVSLQFQNMMHWSQAFESEGTAKFAVDSALANFHRQLPNNPTARSYIIQQSIVILLGTDDACRDLLNGPMIPSLRPDAVMRL